jgi:hypothetical protein
MPVAQLLHQNKAGLGLSRRRNNAFLNISLKNTEGLLMTLNSHHKCTCETLRRKKVYDNSLI